MDKIPTEWAVTVITGVIAWLGNKLWNKASEKQKKIIDAALEEARSVIRSLVLTARPGTTAAQIEIWCKGAIAIQLAKRGIDPENKIVKAVTSQLVAEGITLFIDLHPDKPSLSAPIAVKLGTAAPDKLVA